MDKDTYETYEFHGTENDANQFFVVQDDGTFLINRQVQYVAQVQDVKETLEAVQPCTVYDVSSQQFFVDVDNSSELLTVSSPYILPEGENGLYNNSYLLQPTASPTVEQMDEDVIVDQYKETDTQEDDVDVVTYNSNQTNNFAEITLSDEQCRTLEQKGWILLESLEKIFVLNTLGLHDITANEKLVQKLKNELQNTDTEDKSGCMQTENMESRFPNIVTQSSTNQHETVEFVIGNNVEQDENSAMENYEFAVDGKDTAETQDNVEQENIEVPSLEMEAINKSSELETVESEPYQHAKSIKIKTKLNFKDIPDNILLGTTVNGKRLVAKVTSRQFPTKTKVKTKSQKNGAPLIYEDNTLNQQHNVIGLLEAQFVSLVQQSVRGRLRRTSPEDLASADNVVTQLLKVPNIKKSLVEQNLIITKVSNKKDEYGVLYNSKSQAKLVTGRVALKDDVCAFEHIPDMLQNMKTSSDDPNVSQTDGCNDHIDVFHIHITETKCIDNIARVSVMLNKRQLSTNLIYDMKRRYPYTIFACGGCASTFKNEDALKDHQENDCFDAEDNMLTIDTDSTNKACSILKGGNGNEYICTLCDAKFSSLKKCENHIKIHVGPSLQETDTTEASADQNDSPKKSCNEVYKCKMCPSVYFHPPSLSKHIVNRHINVKST